MSEQTATETIDPTIIVQASKEHAEHFFEVLDVEKAHELSIKVGTLLEANKDRVVDVVGALLSLLCGVVTDPERNSCVEEMCIDAGGISMAFTKMLTTHEAFHGDANSPIPMALATPTEGSASVEKHIQFSVDGDNLSKDVVTAVVDRHMRNLQEELKAMAEAVTATKN